MSSDESDSPTSLVPPGLVRIKNEQSPSLIKVSQQENGAPTIQIVQANSGADGVSSSGSAAVLMPVGGKLNALPLGSAVKVSVKNVWNIFTIVSCHRRLRCSYCDPSIRRLDQASSK